MDNKRKKDLNGLYDILKRSNSIYFLERFYYYLSFLKKVYPNDQYIINLFNKVNYSYRVHGGKLIKMNCEILSKVKEFEEKNKEYFSKTIPSNNLLYCKNNINMISQEELKSIILNFALSLSNEFYLFVKYVIDNNKIFLPNKCNDLSNGFSMLVSVNFGGYYIYLNHFLNIDDLLVLVHEIGHLYYYYLNNIANFKLKKPEAAIKEEIVPRMMEWLLIEYFGLYNKLYMENATISLNNSIICDDKSKSEYIRMRYQLGDFASWASKDYINKEISFDNFVRYIYHTDYHEVLENANRSHQKIISKR